MSGFTLRTKYETEFEGDKVTMYLARLTRNQTKHISKFLDEDEEGVKRIRFSDSMEMLDCAAHFMSDVVHDFTGLTDAAGQQISFKDTVMEQQYFSDLVTEILGEVLRITFMNEETAKKLEKKQEEDGTQDTSEEEVDPVESIALEE